jgi:two-component system, OmpR family, sensor histidine kinase KdpD
VAVEQVVVNLLDNAVEHTPPGTPISVGAASGPDGVTLEVADRGPGLPPGAEGKIFDKFYRAAPAAGRRRGIGLGLAIARGIVEAHGGRVDAHNRPGGGAAFRVTFPADGTPPAIDASA